VAGEVGLIFRVGDYRIGGMAEGDGLTFEQKRVIANLETAEDLVIIPPAEASKGIRAVKGGKKIEREDLKVESTAPDLEDMLPIVQEAAKIKALAEKEVIVQRESLNKAVKTSRAAGKK